MSPAMPSATAPHGSRAAVRRWSPGSDARRRRSQRSQLEQAGGRAPIEKLRYCAALHSRARGGERQPHHVVLDGFQLIRDPDLRRLQNRPERRFHVWRAIDVSMWKGHRAYIELIDSAIPTLSHGEVGEYKPRLSNGYLAVDEIRFRRLPDAASRSRRAPLRRGDALPTAIARSRPRSPSPPAPRACGRPWRRRRRLPPRKLQDAGGKAPRGAPGVCLPVGASGPVREGGLRNASADFQSSAVSAHNPKSKIPKSKIEVGAAAWSSPNAWHRRRTRSSRGSS